MAHLIGVVGFIGCGKGTVSDFLVNNYNFKQDSFAKSLKDATSQIFGWSRDLLEGDTKESRAWREMPDKWWGEKLGITNFTPRYALQIMGTDVIRNNLNQGIWFLTLENRLRQETGQNIVISDVRFPNELKFIKDNGGIIVRIKRGDDPAWYNEAALANNGDLNMEMQMATYGVHKSEWAWVGYQVDYTITNDSTIDELHRSVSRLIQEL